MSCSFYPPLPSPQICFAIPHSSPSHPLQICISCLAAKFLRRNAQDSRMASTLNRTWRFCSDAKGE